MQFKNKQEKQFIEKKTFEEQLEKMNFLFKKIPFIRIVKNNLQGDAEEFVIYVSQYGINLVEEDEKTLLFGKK